AQAACLYSRPAQASCLCHERAGDSSRPILKFLPRLIFITRNAAPRGPMDGLPRAAHRLWAAAMPLGYLCLVLHAHLPFVRHPEYGDCLEEDWLYEAITETYIPLLEVFDSLERDGVDWRLTMSVTPTLAAMLSDPLLQYRYVQRIENLIRLAGKEVERTRWEPEFNHLARMYHARFCRAREVFVNQYQNNLLNGFRR